tara:strand:- start:1015 stop:1308 length:294 start_codon:yes stop_codon:yes gene_type:complete
LAHSTDVPTGPDVFHFTHRDIVPFDVSTVNGVAAGGGTDVDAAPVRGTCIKNNNTEKQLVSIVSWSCKSNHMKHLKHKTHKNNYKENARKTTTSKVI